MMRIVIENWGVEELGYTPITTFWEDFCIAEGFGMSAVKETFERCFEEWKHDYKYLTELVMVLNHKIWRWYERNERVARLYNELWKKADGYAMETLKGEEMDYFFRVTD